MIPPAAAQKKSDNAMEIVADGFATVTESCRFLGVSRATLYKMMDTNDLIYAKFGRSRRLPWTALKEFAGRCLVGAQQQ
jgi:excisionase family DNA binding protein